MWLVTSLLCTEDPRVRSLSTEWQDSVVSIEIVDVYFFIMHQMDKDRVFSTICRESDGLVAFPLKLASLSLAVEHVQDLKCSIDKPEKSLCCRLAAAIRSTV